MNNCVHQWIYIGSKRQDVWRCIFCDEYKINDATPQREWVGLMDEEISKAYNEVLSQPMREQDKPVVFNVCRAIEAKLKEKNT